MRDVFICDYIRTPIGRFGIGAILIGERAIRSGEGVAIVLERV
jgi:hypothetical protein